MESQSIAQQFIAETGVYVPAVTAEQMRELDWIATEETGPTLLQMMENAGRNLALLTMRLLGARWKHTNVFVLAGTGGNGGGGICSARHLSTHGVTVNLCLTDPNRLSEAAAFQRKIFQSTTGNQVNPGQTVKSTPDFIIDALIGYGLKTFHSGTTTELIDWANSCNASILSLDVPSGLEASAGAAPGQVICPTWTMTLALPKTGLRSDNCGQLFLADIGIPVAVIRRLAPTYEPPYGKRFYVRLKRL